MMTLKSAEMENWYGINFSNWCFISARNHPFYLNRLAESVSSRTRGSIPGSECFSLYWYIICQPFKQLPKITKIIKCLTRILNVHSRQLLFYIVILHLQKRTLFLRLYYFNSRISTTPRKNVKNNKGHKVNIFFNLFMRNCFSKLFHSSFLLLMYMLKYFITVLTSLIYLVAALQEHILIYTHIDKSVCTRYFQRILFLSPRNFPSPSFKIKQ